MSRIEATSSGPFFKVPVYRNPKLLEAIRNAPRCFGCDAPNDGTIVAAHANEGKGMALKASDASCSALCFRCHARLDQGRDMSRDERRAFVYIANAKTLRWLIETDQLVLR